MKKASFIQASVPASRGPAAHIERQDDTAMTAFNHRGEVTEIHTPQATLQRIHEVLHARHTRIGEYGSIRTDVADIIEDCRLHMKHWPWNYADGKFTPRSIVKATSEALAPEIKDARTKLKDYEQFAVLMRANAVQFGVKGDTFSYTFPHGTQSSLYVRLFQLIYEGKHQLAAKLLEKTFFEVEKPKEDKPKKKYKPAKGAGEAGGSSLKPDEIDPDEADEMIQRMMDAWSKDIPPMTTHELPFVEPITEATTGFRLATSGARIYRPALRRPVLPHRLFIKRAPVSPGGAILFDSSGSMQVNDELLTDCCLRATTATIAFYNGDGRKGDLYIFAREGMRAKGINKNMLANGNNVDGHALDWLMKQDGPRIFVTDREFCGSADSTMQVARLQRLENDGEVKVYETYALFQEAYPHKARAA